MFIISSACAVRCRAVLLCRAVPCGAVRRALLYLLFRTSYRYHSKFHNTWCRCYTRFVRTTLLDHQKCTPALFSPATAQQRCAVRCRAVSCRALRCDGVSGCAMLSFEHTVPGISEVLGTRYRYIDYVRVYSSSCFLHLIVLSRSSSCFLLSIYTRTADQNVTLATSTQPSIGIMRVNVRTTTTTTGHSALHK